MKLLSIGMVALCAALFAGEKTVKIEDLPAAVQSAVREQTKNATLSGLSIEKENGKTLYEVETKVNGRSRDLMLDQSGAVVETEEEVDLDSIPALAKAAIEKRAAAGGGHISKVERATAGSDVSYEATIKTKSGKTIEYGVTSDGKPKK